MNKLLVPFTTYVCGPSRKLEKLWAWEFRKGVSRQFFLQPPKEVRGW
jgi:hypothetical protein